MKISRFTIIVLIVCILFLQSCQTAEKKDAVTEDFYKSAFQMLNESRFQEAKELSQKSIIQNKNNSPALAVNVISSYILAILEFRNDVNNLKGSSSISMISNINEALHHAENNFKEIQKNLDILSKDKSFKFKFTPGNLKIDLNGNNQIEPSEENLTAVVTGSDGNKIEPQRPEFVFDHSDVLWAQSYISLHLAYICILSSFDYTNLMFLAMRSSSGESKNEIKVKLKDKKYLIDAHDYLLQMVNYSDQTRMSVLEETDDEMEWLPNLSQKSCPLPMSMTQKVFDNWETYTELLRDLFEGKTVLNFNGLSSGKKQSGNFTAKGGINIKRLLTEPKDITFNMDEIKRKGALVDTTKNLDPFMEEVFGSYYEYKKPASPIVKKFIEMNNDIKAGEDTFNNKFKYLLWIN